MKKKKQTNYTCSYKQTRNDRKEEDALAQCISTFLSIFYFLFCIFSPNSLPANGVSTVVIKIARDRRKPCNLTEADTHFIQYQYIVTFNFSVFIFHSNRRLFSCRASARIDSQLQRRLFVYKRRRTELQVQVAASPTKRFSCRPSVQLRLEIPSSQRNRGHPDHGQEGSV